MKKLLIPIGLAAALISVLFFAVQVGPDGIGADSFQSRRSSSGSTVTKSIPFSIENPTSTEDLGIFLFNATSTITKVLCLNKTLDDSITFNLIHTASRKAVTTTDRVFTANQACTATTTPTVFTSFASSTVNTGDVLRFMTTAASSSEFTLTVFYTEN